MDFLRARSLSAQAFGRISMVFVALGAASALLLWLAWHAANHLLYESRSQAAQAALEQRLEQLYDEWETAASQFSATLTFNRMLEDPTDRWIRLMAYITTLGDSFGFHSLLVLDHQGQALFTLNQEAIDLLRAYPNPQQTRWFYNKAEQHLNRVIHLPIWLGAAGGKGHLILTTALDNSTLSGMAGPEMQLYLISQGEVIASSLGNRLVGKASPCQADADQSDSTCLQTEILGPDLALDAQIDLPQAIQAWQLSLLGIVLFGLLAVFLHLTLGRWLRRTVLRVESLSQAAALFERQRQVDTAVDATIERAGGPLDEIGKLQLSLRELMHSSEEREEESQAYLHTLEILEEAVVEIDPEGKLMRASPAMRTLAGELRSDTNLFDLFEPEDREILVSLIDKLVHGDSRNVTARLRLNPGEQHGGWVECRFVAIDRPVTLLRGVLRDITQSYLQEKHIAHMALHDALTGLPNRILLEDRISVALRMASRQEQFVAVGFIDLDNFKQVNDALGHKMGDQLLVAFAENVRRQLRKGDTLARWGGDEFVVLLPEMDGLQAVREVADKLARASRTPIPLDGQNFPVTFSMGFAVYPDDSVNVDQLLSQADQAMFYAKSQGRNTVCYFSDIRQHGPDKKDLYIQSRLAIALEEKRLTAWFQPIVDAHTHQLLGLEALARWHDEQLGWVSPATFIPMLESMGLIHELGALILEQTMTLGRQLRDLGCTPHLAVNVSKRQLYTHNFIEQLETLAQQAGIAPHQIVLEITESIAMGEVAFAQERLNALTRAGFRIAIDDFGVGYSSLSMLHEMPVDELKIDMSFTRRVHEIQGARVIQAIIGMSQALNLRTVAEGVEDAETASALARMGVHCLQGYHFAKPMSQADLMQWLARQSAA